MSTLTKPQYDELWKLSKIGRPFHIGHGTMYVPLQRLIKRQYIRYLGMSDSGRRQFIVAPEGHAAVQRQAELDRNRKV